MTTVRKLVAAGVAATAVIGVAGLAPAAQATGPTVTVVASGLHNPRDLAFGPNGHLYVAEAGTGGSHCFSGGEEGETCVGFTSTIADITGGHVRRVVRGVISAGGSDGTFATGVDGITFDRWGHLYGIVTGSQYAIPPEAPRWLAQKAAGQLGRVIVATGDGSWRRVANVGAVDWRWSNRHQDLVPGQFPDANPYGIAAVGKRLFYVDAGTNVLGVVNAERETKILNFFPNPAVSDAVPTCVDRGKDGALYVGELTGGGNANGAAKVYRVVPGQAPTVWLTGFTGITGCGFGSDGSFYVTEFQVNGLFGTDPAGDVVRIAPDGTRTVLGAGQLFFPGGFAAGKDGSIYVSNWSISTTGTVVKIG